MARTTVSSDRMSRVDRLAEEARLARDTALAIPLDVLREGNAIIIPENMDLDDVIAALVKKQNEESSVVNVHEEVDAFPFDGAIAFMSAMRQEFGWATAVPTPSFFGPVRPTTIDVETDYHVYQPVIWGSFSVPGIDGRLETSAMWGDKPKFVIGGEVKQKSLAQVKRLAAATRAIVAKESIYKGKAIRLVTDTHGKLVEELPPTFLDLSQVDERELIFPQATMDLVATNLWTPIEHTQECREHRIPLKRGILLEGKYGVGKTLTAYVTAKKSVANKWTFIYLDRVDGLRDALLFARRYAPAVVFAEDIDRVVKGERDIKIDDVLNVIDGVDSKHAEVLVILTTNFVEKIDKAMLRPGRLDAVISLTAPDREAAARLVRLYARNLLPESETLEASGKELEGQIPAVIREVVERAKLGGINHLGPDGVLQLNDGDIASAALGMRNHLELLNPVKERTLTSTERIGEAMSDVVRGEIKTALSNGTTDPLVEKVTTSVRKAFGR